MGDGKSCNIEVQRSGKEHHLKRVRYNASCITANITEPGEKFQNVPDVAVVYISETDIFKANCAIYHTEYIIRETNESIDNGLQEIYINAAIDDGSEVSELMKCFLQKEVRNDKFPKLSERVHYFKHDEEGVKIMCAISEEIREEGREEGIIRQNIKHFVKGRITLEEALEDIEMSEEEFEIEVEKYKESLE